MKKDPPDQLRLGLEDPGAEQAETRRPRRRRTFRKPLRGFRRPPQVANVRLMQMPVAARCGLCGQRLTIHGDVAACPTCHTIVSRPDSEDTL
jgi:hypothetical protein